MRKNYRLRRELIQQGLITPAPTITPQFLWDRGFVIAAVALLEEQQYGFAH